MIDLHVHSTCSDGTYTPSALVEYAYLHDISAFALTDHDTTAGLDEAITRAGELSGVCCEQNPDSRSVEVIPGIEFSTEHEGKDIHVVGLFIDYRNPHFQSSLNTFVNSRTERNKKMCRLFDAQGIPITYEALLGEFPDAVITRAHYAKYLLEHGYVKSMAEAFDRYLGDHACCFVPREKVTPSQAVKLILSAGGVPVLAHPTLYHMGRERLEALVAELKNAGLAALEGCYSSYSPAETREMHALAKKYDLLISGGSDFHGANKPGLSFGTGYGRLYLPEDMLKPLREAADS